MAFLSRSICVAWTNKETAFPSLFSFLMFFFLWPPVCRGEEIGDDAFIKWANLAEARPFPASHMLYAHQLEMGFKIFLITGSFHSDRNVTEKNLGGAGYHSW